eukprot:jgi/Orpsp1_1/1187357/evm.model.d7180000057109.1
MSFFVRPSKFRHVFGTPYRRPDCYENLRITRNAWDTNLVKVNPLFISVNLQSGGGGTFTVISHDKTGKLPDNLPCFNGHSACVLDTDFNPFNDYIIASGSEDTKVMVWNIPENGLTESISTPVLTLEGHKKKVGHVLFHPTADNLLSSSSADMTIRLWDISKGAEMQNIDCHPQLVQSLDWNYNGDLLTTTCKDKKLRVIDARTGKVASETNGHQGIKGSRVCWLGDSDKIATTGFSRMSDRQLFLWDAKNLKEPIKQESIDTSSGILMPFYDNDTKLLFLAGKGDGNIRYYEIVDDDTMLYFISEFKSSEPQRGMGFLPKRAVNTNEVEIDRLYKLQNNCIEPISFKVPRKSDAFASDIYPDTIGDKPALTCEDFFKGKSAKPILINLETKFKPSAKKELKIDEKEVKANAEKKRAAAEAEKNKPILDNKELTAKCENLQKENETLRDTIKEQELKIKQLEKELHRLKLFR